MKISDFTRRTEGVVVTRSGVFRSKRAREQRNLGQCKRKQFKRKSRRVRVVLEAQLHRGRSSAFIFITTAIPRIGNLRTGPQISYTLPRLRNFFSLFFLLFNDSMYSEDAQYCPLLCEA